MKIALNLAASQSRRERYGLVWGAPVSFAAVVLLIYFLLSALRTFGEYRKVHRSLVELQDREARLRNREKTVRNNLERPQSREVFREAQFVNTLISKKRLSLTELTLKVSKLLPRSVHLASLALAQAGHEPLVRFTVVGDSNEAVYTFLNNLEDSPDFTEVANVNEGVEQKASPGGSVTMACTARYVGGEPQ